MAAGGEVQPRPDVATDAGIEALLDGLAGDARRDRAELIAWLLDRGFTVDQIGASLTPMMLSANRVMGDDGAYVSTREMSRLGTPPRCPAMCGAPRVRRAIGSLWM